MPKLLRSSCFWDLRLPKKPASTCTCVANQQHIAAPMAEGGGSTDAAEARARCVSKGGRDTLKEDMIGRGDIGHWLEVGVGWLEVNHGANGYCDAMAGAVVGLPSLEIISLSPPPQPGVSISYLVALS